MGDVFHVVLNEKIASGGVRNHFVSARIEDLGLGLGLGLGVGGAGGRAGAGGGHLGAVAPLELELAEAAARRGAGRVRSWW